MRARGLPTKAIEVGEPLFSERVASLEWVAHDDVTAAWEIFRTFADKTWSFTDCVSRVVMQRLSIRTAFAFDEHFRKFGTVTVVP